MELHQHVTDEVEVWVWEPLNTMNFHNISSLWKHLCWRTSCWYIENLFCDWQNFHFALQWLESRTVVSASVFAAYIKTFKTDNTLQIFLAKMRLEEILPFFKVIERKKRLLQQLFLNDCSSNLLPDWEMKGLKVSKNVINDLDGTKCILRKFAGDTKLLRMVEMPQGCPASQAISEVRTGWRDGPAGTS